MKSRGRAIKRALAVGFGASIAPWLVLGAMAARTPIPAALLQGAADPSSDRDSVRITDRSGTVLAEVRDEEGMRQRRVRLTDLGEPIRLAILAAEDARFYRHAGVDPVALARALVTSIAQGRVTSGASTLTQQLARTLLGAPRTLAGKLDVMALALKLEASFTKDRILEEYLNRIEFGPNVRGAEAAAWTYFGKPAKSLSYAEAAALASIPRGPTVYDPGKHPAALKARRDRVLDRMVRAGSLTSEEAERGKAEQIVIGGRYRTASAPHFVAVVERGRVDPCAPPDALPAGVAVVRTTLIADLQRDVEQAARATVRELAEQRVSAASVVVLDNESGDVLAYVGSPDASDATHLGGNDGVIAKRQPGSTLKPFVYELAMDRGVATPATMLPDVEMSFVASDGDAFRPKNYDHLFHGPVLARQALGNSLNVPAVWLTDRLGTASVVERLRDVGLCSLTESPSHYGVGVALGDGEVTLMELTAAYAGLARGSSPVRPRAILDMELPNGDRVESATTPLNLEPRKNAPFIIDILKDARARASSFGESTVFDLPFEVAAKTGTSKGFRDNWAIGSTTQITVGVWVGNFDGSPMHDVSGIAGAGPLFRAAMLAATRYVKPSSFEPPTASSVEICPLSGKLAGPSCPHHRTELVPADAKLEECDMHVRVRVDKETGERAGPACDASLTEERVFERFPPLMVPWAKAAQRPLVPDTFSARCPGETFEAGGVAIVYPEQGARFYLSGGRASHVEVRAAFAAGTKPLVLLDGALVPTDPLGHALIELTPGSHTLIARAGAQTSEPIQFTVE